MLEENCSINIPSILSKLEIEIMKDKREMMMLVNTGVIDLDTGESILKAKYLNMLIKNENANKELCDKFINVLFDTIS